MPKIVLSEDEANLLMDIMDDIHGMYSNEATKMLEKFVEQRDSETRKEMFVIAAARQLNASRLRDKIMTAEEE
jgi:DNA-nicking Smr family endonuclease